MGIFVLFKNGLMVDQYVFYAFSRLANLAFILVIRFFFGNQLCASPYLIKPDLIIIKWGIVFMTFGQFRWFFPKIHNWFTQPFRNPLILWSIKLRKVFTIIGILKNLKFRRWCYGNIFYKDLLWRKNWG